MSELFNNHRLLPGQRVRLDVPPLLGVSTDTATIRQVKKGEIEIVLDGWSIAQADQLWVPSTSVLEILTEK